jgi:hypothetical protein
MTAICTHISSNFIQGPNTVQANIRENHLIHQAHGTNKHNIANKRLPVLIQNEKYASCHVTTFFATRTPLTAIPNINCMGYNAALTGSNPIPPDPIFVPRSVSASPISANSFCLSSSDSSVFSLFRCVRASESPTRLTQSTYGYIKKRGKFQREKEQ